MRRALDGLAAWLLVGAIGWVGVMAIGWMLWQSTPPRAGFDLALLLEAARRVTAGSSPYDPGMLAGTSPSATSLFYSYPPPVAQAMTLVSWLPDGVVLVLWGLGATLGLAGVGWRISEAAGRGDRAATDAVKTAMAAPLVLPFAVAVLFGNLDAWYGLAFGALVLGVAVASPTRDQSIAGGIALGAVAVAKLHPGLVLVWLLVRSFTGEREAARRTLVAAAVTVVVIVAASVAIGGLDPWRDYLAVVGAGAGAAVVDPRNVGPVSLLGQLVGLDGTGVKLVQAVVSLAALGVTVLAAVRIRDPLASLAVAITACLVVLPVTWYHYPVALMPVGLALVATRPAARARVALAGLIASLAIGFVPLLWAAVGVLLAAARIGSEAGPVPRLRVLRGDARE